MRSTLLLLAAAATAASAHAQVVWTGTVSNDIFDEANWDLTNSMVTVIDPQVGAGGLMSIDDDVMISNVSGTMAPEIPDIAGGQWRFQVEENRTMTLSNAELNLATGSNDGIGCTPLTLIGFDIEVTNNSTLNTFFIVNEVRVDVDSTSRVWFGGGGNPVNLSYVNMTNGAVVEFDQEDPTEFMNEHLIKFTVDGNPAVIGGNLDVVTNGASGSIVTVIPTTIGSNYCMANNNSTGVPAMMVGTGSASVANNDLVIYCTDMPDNSFSFFLTSMTQGFVANPGGSEGNLCLGGAIGRYVGPGQIQNSGAAGQVSLALDLTMHPTPTGLVSVAASETWNFTCWFRDVNASGMAVSNFADGLEVLFQ